MDLDKMIEEYLLAKKTEEEASAKRKSISQHLIAYSKATGEKTLVASNGARVHYISGTADKKVPDYESAFRYLVEIYQVPNEEAELILEVSFKIQKGRSPYIRV